MAERNGKIPMVSVESERALVGCLLQEADRVVPIMRNSFRLKPQAFGVSECRAIVQVVYDMMEGDKVRDVNLISVMDWLKTSGLMKSAGGGEYVMECEEWGVSTHVQSYCDIVRQKWIAREVERVSREIGMEARKAKSGDDLLRRSPEKYMGIVDDVVEDESNADVLVEELEECDRASEARDRGERYVRGLQSPWGELNYTINGFENGNMIVIAGRPSQGKTTIAEQVLCHVAEVHGPVAFVSLEMPRRDLLTRDLCRMSGVSMPKLRSGFVKKGGAQWDEVQRNKKVLEGLPLHILEGESDLNAILTWLRMMKRKHDIRMFAIDYIQKMWTGDAHVDAHGNVRVSKISDALKNLCTNLGIPGLVLSQLSRSMEKDGRYPLLSDLRDSGSIEQDADMVILTYRNTDDDVEENLGTKINLKNCRPQYIEVAKNRNGATGKVSFWFHAPYFRHEALPGGMDHADEGMRPHYTGNDHGPRDSAGSRDDGGNREMDVELDFD